MDHYQAVMLVLSESVMKKRMKKHQLLIQKTYQFINVVNGVSHSHKTAKIFFFHLTQ